MGLEFTERGFDLPALRIQRRQLAGRRCVGVQNRRQQAIERLAVRHSFELIVDHPHLDAASPVPPVPLAGIELAQIGAVGEPSLHREAQVLLAPPQQRRARGLCLLPQRVAQKVAVGQTEHVFFQCRQHLFRQRDFSRRIGAQAAGEQHMGAVFHQRHETDLRKGTAAATRSGTPAGLPVALLIGHVQSATVKRHQPPAAIESAFGLAPRQRTQQLVVELLERLPAQPRAGLRDPRVARHRQRLARSPQPLQPFQQAAQHLAVGDLHVERQGNHVVDHHVSWQVALPTAGSAALPQHPFDRGTGKPLSHHAQADVVGHPRALRQSRQSACHRPTSCVRKQDTTRLFLSDEYCSEPAFLIG